MLIAVQLCTFVLLGGIGTMSMQVTIGATEVRNNFGTLLNRVYQGDEHLVVEKLGIPVAVLIGVKEYENFQRWQALQHHQRLARTIGKEAVMQGLTEEMLQDELKETRQQVFNETYGDLH